jgi:proteasome lid subunit RPN8/RPN11
MSWDTGEKCTTAEKCSWSEQYRGATIWISPEVQAVIRKLCADVVEEWQMMLTGVEKKEGVFVTGYWIPKQEITQASVTNLDCIDAKLIEEKGIVATIHSHGTMGVFFSTTDVESTNSSLIKNHIVVNNKGEMKATMRYELPCGLTHFFEATAKVVVPVIDTIEGFENITKKTYVHTYPMGKTWKDDTWVGGKNYQNAWNTKHKKNKKSKRPHALELERGYTNQHGVQIYT